MEAETNLTPATVRVNRRLIELMGGDKDKARAEVEALIEQPDLLFAWADRMYEESVARDIEAERQVYQRMIEANADKDDGRIYGFNYDWLSKFQQDEREALASRTRLTLDDLPGTMRSGALAGLAISFLTHKLESERKAGSEAQDSEDFEDVGL